MALLAMGGLAPAAAGAPLAVPASSLALRQEGMVLWVEGGLTVQADKAVAWQVLTDYPRFPEFVPGIASNQVISVAGNGRKTLAQRGQILAGQVRMVYEGLVDVTEYPGEGLDILFLTGPFKDVRGSWRILAGTPLKLSYTMRMDLNKAPFPPPLASNIVQEQVRTWVEAFGREIERRGGK
jgi:ribosome-associated toxin RatA of RatAB toxin-antitoxin module